jgi:ABC-type molybdenum transport system ATPase subunit/photorepair protein PhrA
VLYLDESHTLQKKKKKKNKNKKILDGLKLSRNAKKILDGFLWTVKNRIEYNVAK